ncbi:DNA repair protein RecO [Microbulbifer guangxiensis]|uniref:DNA repair protein RecO n=1 Tax=Microbulbifer guangxiensis TaxID=2904249 RepID=UPI001EFF8335|nr:DNA repair protein RecO [Microbulbifer guangxiensis]
MAQPQSPLLPAYILHSRPYSDSSLILELLTPEHGRIGCVARGARRDKQRRQQALQPFSPLLVTLMGRGELKTLGPVESAGSSHWLRGRAVYGGLYVNELLVRMLPVAEAQYQVFAAYQDLLGDLNALGGEDSNELLAPLRRFELRLLGELGNCPSLDYCAGTRGPLDKSGRYRLVRETGFIPVHRGEGAAARVDEFTGAELLGLHSVLQGEHFSPEFLGAAKRLTGLLLGPLLGEKPLRSRELFRQVYGKQ